jgi:hypothetical protein
VVSKFGTSSTYKNKISVHINVRPVTFSLWGTAERILSSPVQLLSASMLVTGRPACFATSTYKQPLCTFSSSCWKMYHCQSEQECGTCMVLLPAVRDVLSNTCHARWMGGLHAPRQIWILWTFTCGAPQDPCVCSSCWQRRGIVDACQTIRNCPGIFARMRRSVMRWVEACIESNGGHFEHVLRMYSFSCNSQIKCFRAHDHVDMVCGTLTQILSAPFSYTLYIHMCMYIWTYVSYSAVLSDMKNAAKVQEDSFLYSLKWSWSWFDHQAHVCEIIE